MLLFLNSYVEGLLRWIVGDGLGGQFDGGLWLQSVGPTKGWRPRMLLLAVVASDHGCGVVCSGRLYGGVSKMHVVASGHFSRYELETFEFFWSIKFKCRKGDSNGVGCRCMSCQLSP